MGCGASTSSDDDKITPLAQATSKKEKPKSIRSGSDDSEKKSVRWKVVPTATQARDKYEADGTLSKTSDGGHLELRQLLEEPMGQNYIGAFAKEVKAQEAFMCWIDIQEFKSIPTDDYRRSKGLHIYHKYIKAGAVLQIGGVDTSEVEGYKVALENSKEDSKLVQKDFFDKIQTQCFLEMYQNVYLRFKKSAKYAEMEQTLKSVYNKVQLNDFDFLGKLGEGGFGLVVHCRKRSTGRHYAMKIQTKKGLLECFADDPWRVAYEKNAFVSCQHPFIVNLDYAFQTETLAIMVLGLATAGDLQYAINSSPEERISEERTQFYVAEIILALAHLHAMGLMYRDLKPNNVLLNADGNIQLVDMGGVVDNDGKTLGLKSQALSPLFSQGAGGEDPNNPNYSNQRRMSIMGTFGYMAPEMVIMMSQSHVEKSGYTNAVDWWSLGVTMYKLLTGVKPFDNDTAITSYLESKMSFFAPGGVHYSQEYLMLFRDIYIPDYMSANAADLINGLLDVNENTRLGAGPAGLHKLKAHAFFEGIDWDKLEQKHLIPPYIPDVPKLLERAHFPDFETMMSTLMKNEWMEDKPKSDEHKYFQGWDFVSPSTLKMEFGIAHEMAQYDSNFKVRQLLGEKGGPARGAPPASSQVNRQQSMKPSSKKKSS
mmetsp:Transcript_32448/g.33074  ORF Transcript_32448/g.33074 Transcript_32448/m.33074 type:complete len:652 (+) Transcript_32448:150-2105(+)